MRWQDIDQWGRAMTIRSNRVVVGTEHTDAARVVGTALYGRTAEDS